MVESSSPFDSPAEATEASTSIWKSAWFSHTRRMTDALVRRSPVVASTRSKARLNVRSPRAHTETLLDQDAPAGVHHQLPDLLFGPTARPAVLGSDHSSIVPDQCRRTDTSKVTDPFGNTCRNL